MAEIATNFPPQTYSSSFFLNSLTDDEKNVGGETAGKRSDSTPLLDCFISTMNRVVIVLIIASFYRGEVGGLECVLPRQGNTRVFDSLTAFQGNKITFSPQNGGWEGSNVEFSFSAVEGLEKNSFVALDSQFVISLKLSGKRIKRIEDGAFISLLCLHYLYLDRNNITELSRNVFQDLGNLETLDLSHNKLEAVEDLVFASLTRLKILHLSHNEIKKFGALAFTNLTSLEYLNLEGNSVKKITNYEVFKPLVSLTTLILARNKFLEIEPEKWTGLSKLQVLDLGGNGLDHFDTTYSFTFLTLKSLNLSSNFLTTLNVLGLKTHLPQLEMIDLNNNPWVCDDLEAIIHELNDSRIKFATSNNSGVNVYGIACSYVSVTIKTTTQAATTTGRSNVSWVDRKQLENYVDTKIKDNNEQLKMSLRSIRSFVIFVFAFVCVYILFEILVRTNICGYFVNKFRRGNDLYVDDSTDVENFRLLHR